MNSTESKLLRSRAHKALRWLERVLACIGLCFLVYHVAFEFTAMTSDSMSPTLQGTSYEDGDRVVLEKVTGWFRAPRRWEIYHYFDSDGVAVAKRIIGLPGERICIRTNELYINDLKLRQPRELASIQYYALGSLAGGREVDCKNGYFMMGDASIDSYDSRFTGIVTKERLRSRVWCIVWPFARARFVN